MFAIGFLIILTYFVNLFESIKITLFVFNDFTDIGYAICIILISSLPVIISIISITIIEIRKHNFMK